MKLLDVLKSVKHEECNELAKGLLKKELELKQKDLVKLGLDSSKSLLISLSKMLQDIKENEL